MSPPDPPRTRTDRPDAGRHAGARRATCRIAAWAALGLAALVGAARDSAADAPRFTPLERARILAFGPWPASPPATDDAPAALRARIALGERLFHSVRLAGAGGVRCASCHEPFRAYTDGRARAAGRAPGARNTPTLLDVARHRVFGWDGARHRLEEQSLRPLREPGEMDASPAHVAALVRADADWRAAWLAAFGTRPDAVDDDTVFADVGRALAAFEATLASPRAPFDAWRDAFAAGRSDGATLPPAALRGLRLFVGRGGCVDCHGGPTLGDDALHVSTIRSLRPDGTPDAGPAGGPAFAFRTPALRGVAATAPYMHDGSVARLCDAARPHALADGTRDAPAALDASERDDLAAFLRTLAAEAFAADDAGRRCASG